MGLFKNLPFEWMIGLRYTRAGKRSARNSFISFISLISMAGIARGVAALIVVLSVMNGFQKEVRDRMLSVLSHIEVFDASGSLPDWRVTAAEAMRNKEVRGAAPYVEAQAMVTREADKRKALYTQMQAILHEEVPAVLPAGGDNFMIRKKNIRNLTFHPQIWSVQFDKVWKA